MKRPHNGLIASVLAPILLIFGWWAYREFNLRYTQWEYSRELKRGTTRQAVEDHLLSRGIRFFAESPSVNFVSVGDEVRYTLACTPREVGLLLDFNGQDATSSGTDVLEAVRAVRQERGCM